jgi:hypothetical protein
VSALSAILLLQSAAAEDISRALSIPVSVRFERVPLKEATAKILQQAGLGAVEWPEDHAELHRPVTLTLRDVRARSALRAILKPRGLALALQEGRLRVLSEAQARPAPRLEKFNTADLIRRLAAEARRPDLTERRHRYLEDARAQGRRWRDAADHGAPAPEVGLVSDGLALDVEPRVSADRRFVLIGGGATHASLQLPLTTIEVPIVMGESITPPSSDPTFAAALMQELLEAHVGSRGTLLEGNLWIRDTDAQHGRTTKFLRLLAAMK